MDPIEKAIRNAFEKGDARDRAFREKVYRSAFAALDKTLKNNPQVTVEKAIARRKALQTKITQIEAEFVAPPPPVAPSLDMSPSLDGVRPTQNTRPSPRAPQGGPRVEPGFDGIDNPSPVAERSGGFAVDPDMRREPRRRGWGGLLFFLLFLAILAGAGYWAYQNGIIRQLADQYLGSSATTTTTPETTDGQPIEPAPAQPSSSAPPALGEQSDESRNWINVFDPTDPATARATGGAAARGANDPAGPYLEARSNGADGTVVFDVGQGILDQLKGRSATFDIVARGAGGSGTQVSVDCDFGPLGDCGRKRYAITPDRADYLFEVTFPNETPRAGGTITINTDVSGGTGAVDIFEIRVAPAE
ncbi:hypothetical protein NGM99_00670 [Mesorhizobium sp. RP14(2022)]|uniref:Biotin transporter BioY n=1 Tax=Mesorhizobium liriopis TaxID=2953882 RepID=A0ABT1C0D3_9HYPH|nr:hypothetical protein [Mesorhizobium liriopis]MCO6048302.1 hypothetical protein [Mesorhizobium liriopis]